MSNRPQAKADVLQGTLDLMVLQTLDSLGPLHGYAITARLEQVCLEQRGLLRGSWGTTDNNRKARFYTLTPAGRRQLVEEKRAWDRMTAIMQSLLGREA